MNRSVLVALASALPFSAMAADLPSRKAPPPAPVVVAPVFSWTGFYGGLNAGYADPTAKFTVIPGGSWVGDPDVPYTSATSPGVVNASARNRSLQGFTGGAQLGYNYQINNIVLGVEADANYLGLRGSYASPVFNSVANGTYWTRGNVSLDAFYTLRARLGLAADHWLFFVTGGLAVPSERFSQSVNFVNFAPVIALPPTGAAGGANAGSATSAAASWTLGGGIEYALNNQWSVKGEYLYVNLNSMRANSVYGPNGFTGGTWTMQHRLGLSGLNIFRVGVNYHFGT